jgi:hypothetical protein
LLGLLGSLFLLTRGLRLLLGLLGPLLLLWLRLPLWLWRTLL